MQLAAGGAQVAPTSPLIEARWPIFDIGKCWRCSLPLEGGKLRRCFHLSVPNNIPTLSSDLLLVIRQEYSDTKLRPNEYNTTSLVAHEDNAIYHNTKKCRNPVFKNKMKRSQYGSPFSSMNANFLQDGTEIYITWSCAEVWRSPVQTKAAGRLDVGRNSSFPASRIKHDGIKARWL